MRRKRNPIFFGLPPLLWGVGLGASAFVLANRARIQRAAAARAAAAGATTSITPTPAPNLPLQIWPRNQASILANRHRIAERNTFHRQHYLNSGIYAERAWRLYYQSRIATSQVIEILNQAISELKASSFGNEPLVSQIGSAFVAARYDTTFDLLRQFFQHYNVI